MPLKARVSGFQGCGGGAEGVQRGCGGEYMHRGGVGVWHELRHDAAAQSAVGRSCYRPHHKQQVHLPPAGHGSHGRRGVTHHP
eukprot:746331-Prorocentrum_minimum.AAC.1